MSRQSESIARIRAERRSKGQCVGCGKKSATYRCEDCAAGTEPRGGRAAYQRRYLKKNS